MFAVTVRRQVVRRLSGGHLRRVVLFAVLAFIAVVATPTLAAFSAALSQSGSDTAGSLVLATTPAGAGTCNSAGTSSPFTADSTNCAGNVWPSAELSSTSATSLATTFATAGTTAPTSSTLASSAAGLAVEPDSTLNGDDAFPIGGVTLNGSGPLNGGAVTLDGSTGMLETEQTLPNPSGNLTMSAWVKVASGYSSGGEIVGFASSQRGTPGSWAPNLWMDNSGHIAAGLYANSVVQVATSSGTYNDGNWHYVVASFSTTTGLTLYVDGSSVASNSSATSGQSYAGYWTIGWAYGLDYPPVPSSYYLAGSLAEVAVFPAALSSSQVSTLDGETTESAFETQVNADSPSEFWPLQSPSTTTDLPDVNLLPDISPNNNQGTPQGGVTPSDRGPFSASGSMYFDGASDGTSWVETTTNGAALASAFSVAVWFRVPSGWTKGGGLFTFDSAQSGSGAGNDPAAWMDNSGKIVVGTYKSPTYYEATSASAYNNGQWHLLVATVSSSGLKLYVDSATVVTTSGGTAGGASGGYWQIGVLNKSSNWSDAPTNTYWTGDIAHFAYFPSALTAANETTLHGEASVGAYEAAVLGYTPTYYWPLTDSGTTESESFPFFQVEPDVTTRNDDATASGSTVTLGVQGPFTTSSNGVGFSGAGGFLETANPISSPDTLTLVAWFRAPSHSTGGGIVGFDAAQSGAGLSHDRQIWMDNSGKIVAGISGGSGVEATSAATYDDGNWHLVAAVFTPTTLTLYVDAATAVTVSTGISDVNYTGYWTVGFMNNTGTWADMPTNEQWTGSLADVAVLPTAISSANYTTIKGKTTQATLQTELLTTLAASEYWTLSALASAPTDEGGVEISVQAANNATTTCLYPAGAGACPSLSGSDLVPAATTWTPTAPTAAHATTITLSGEDIAAPPAAFAGLHYLIPLTFAGVDSTWTAQDAYLTGNLQF